MILFTALFAHAAPSQDSLGADSEILLEEARRALRNDDYPAVRFAARAALAIPGAHDQEASWLMGRAWHLDGRTEDAIAFYQEGLEQQPHGAFQPTIQLHLAEAVADEEDFRQARKWLRRSQRKRTVALPEATRVSLDKAMWVLESGKLKRGTKKVMAALEDADHDMATWHQGQARTLLVNQWLNVADELGTTDPVLLERRAVLLEACKGQLRKTIDLDHPHWTLDQLYRVGQAYERLGDDVVSEHGALERLPGDARKRVETVWVKASRLYDMGKVHAGRVDHPEEGDLFGFAHDLVVAKVDRL